MSMFTVIISARPHDADKRDLGDIAQSIGIQGRVY